MENKYIFLQKMMIVCSLWENNFKTGHEIRYAECRPGKKKIVRNLVNWTALLKVEIFEKVILSSFLTKVAEY